MQYSVTKKERWALIQRKARHRVCQKQRISFDNLCEFMVDGSTVSQADVAAVFYKFRAIL